MKSLLPEYGIQCMTCSRHFVKDITKIHQTETSDFLKQIIILKIFHAVLEMGLSFSAHCIAIYFKVSPKIKWLTTKMIEIIFEHCKTNNVFFLTAKNCHLQRRI